MSLAALLARKLCHDFAGTAGAIGTVVEMLSEGGDPELVALALDSSAALSATVELYRFVLTPSPEPIGGGRARALVTAWLAAKDNVTLDWPDDEAAWPAGVAALTAGLAMIAAEATRGGTVHVARGVVTGVTVDPDIAAALAGAPAEATRTALAAALAEQAAALGGSLVTAGERLAYQSSRLPR